MWFKQQSYRIWKEMQCKSIGREHPLFEQLGETASCYHQGQFTAHVPIERSPKKVLSGIRQSPNILCFLICIVISKCQNYRLGKLLNMTTLAKKIIDKNWKTGRHEMKRLPHSSGNNSEDIIYRMGETIWHLSTWQVINVHNEKFNTNQAW